MEPVNGYSETAESRFWAKVDQGGDGGCWLWLAALSEHGYGRLGRGGKRGGVVLAHRFAFSTVDEAGLAAAAKRNELFTHNDLDRVAP